jgi:hypothetical protein
MYLVILGAASKRLGQWVVAESQMHEGALMYGQRIYARDKSREGSK